MQFTKKSILLLLILATTALSAITFADTIKFARYPNIHEDKITFTYHGDIWVADSNGSNPYRLTNHVARDIYPRFSPDGKWIAFSSDRMSNYDLYLIPVTGGQPRQLTFHTTDDYLANWTPDGKRLIFRTAREGVFASPLYTVDLEGGLPVPMDMDRGYAGSISPDGKTLAFNRFNFRYWRKHYKGNSNTDIWVQDLATKKIKQLTDTNVKDYREHGHDVYPMWGDDDMIYFMSERSDTYNIWKISPKGGRPKQVTYHKKDGVQYPTMSTDGKTIVYENEFELWRLDLPKGKPQKIEISLDFEPKENLIEYREVKSIADGFSPAPKGDYVAVENHGEIFIVPTDSAVGEKKQVTASPWRDRYPDYAPDGKNLAYVSDESGEEEIWLHNLETGEKRKLTDHESTKRGFLWSHDSKKMVFGAANSLFLLDIKSGDTEELGHNDAYGYRLSDWSKDGKWLIYSRALNDIDQDVFLFNIAEKKEYNLTQNPFRDSSGTFSSDEKFVLFTSSRNSGNTYLYALPLEKVKEDKNDPLLAEMKKKEKKPTPAKPVAPAKTAEKKEDEKKDNDKDEAKKTSNKTEKKPEKKPEKNLAFDMDNIDRRAVQISKKSSSVGRIFVSATGNKVYYTARDNAGSGLFSIDIDGKNEKKVATGSFYGLAITPDKKQFFFREGSSVYKMPVGSGSKKKIDFSFVFTVDKQKEWTQVFEESWRVMKYYFYDEGMNGYDWDAIKARYQPLLKYIGENQDLYDLANEMIGEINASHTGVSGPTRSRPSTYKSRYLGFEMTPEAGYNRVTHIYWNGPADKEWIDLKVGEFVIAIDGKTVREGENYWKILNHALNDYVTVKVNSIPSPKEAREIRIKTVSSLSTIKYNEWVEKNRKYVEKRTNGEIAYVHIKAMDGTSLAKFKNEIDRYHNYKGIVVDIRYNRGGNIDESVLEILGRRAYEYWNNRWASRDSGRRPGHSIQGPKVILINQHSASDSEVTPMGFRDLGIGRVVGNPTYGGVIATNSYRLMNGGSIRTPGALVVTYDPDKIHNYGINLENLGVPPDVWVENTPADEIQGYDRELEAAVKEVLKMQKKGNWRYED